MNETYIIKLTRWELIKIAVRLEKELEDLKKEIEICDKLHEEPSKWEIEEIKHLENLITKLNLPF